MNYNPMLDYQRNQLLAQQAMIQQQLSQIPQNYAPNPPSPQYFVREVSNFDEIKRIPSDPFATYIFPDTQSGKIYLKRLNSDTGRSEYFSYVLENAENENADPILKMNERLERIEKLLGGINVQSVCENRTNAEVYEKSDECNAKSVDSKNAKAKSRYVSESSTNDERKER